MKSLIHNLFVYLAKALAGADGKPSAMRLMTFIVLVQFSVALTFTLIWEVMTNDPDVTTLAGLYMLTVLGCLGMKKWQTDNETKDPAVTVVQQNQS